MYIFYRKRIGPLRHYIITAVFALLPIAELRGAIPYALINDIPLPTAFLMSVGLNACVGPIVYGFLSTLHKILSRMDWYNRFFNKLITRARTRLQGKVAKYGYWGIIIFVAIPLPITGAYTGTLGAWVLGMDKKKTFLAVVAGVIIAGVIVSLVTVFGIETLSFFTKGTT